MRLTESLIKVIFAKAIESEKVEELNAAFVKHLAMDHTFQKVKDEHGGSSWKKVSVFGYQCYDFIKTLPASGGRPAEMAIHRILHEVWPDADGQQPSGEAADQSSSTQAGSKKRKRGNPVPNVENKNFITAFCRLWTLFAEVSRLMRCKDIENAELHSFPERCRELGARWCLLLPSNRCNSHYLHTLMMHGGQFQKRLMEIGLTIGMLENSGAERRHAIGKLQYRRSLCQASCVKGASLDAMYKGALACENRTAYYTLRGTLIWEFGTDMITWEIAEAKKQANEVAEKRYKATRKRDGSGWDAQEHVTNLQSVYDNAGIENPFKGVEKMKNHLESCKDRDKHDDVFFSHAAIFTDEFLGALDDVSAPPIDVDGFEAADQPNVFEDGSITQNLNFPRVGGDDSDSDSTGSSDRSELEVSVAGSADSDDDMHDDLSEQSSGSDSSAELE
jgi:hypothetical protein